MDQARGCWQRLLREVQYWLMEALLLGELGLKAGEMLEGCQGVRLHDLALESLEVQLKPAGC